MGYPILKANLILKGKIKCVTGMHIGGSKEKLEIGGLDSPVIRNPLTKEPYIPGSSIKGKLRHLLEYITGSLDQNASELGDVSTAEEIVRIFGIGADEKETDRLKKLGPTRIIVRDALPDKNTLDMWDKMDSDLDMTEYKPENTIDRITSAANPRFIERVVAGSKFDFEIIYSVYQMSAEENMTDTNADLKNILLALRLLENSTLGKSGSRGYGKIQFYLEKPIWLTKSDYENNTEGYKNSVKEVSSSTTTLQLLKDVDILTYTNEV